MTTTTWGDVIDEALSNSDAAPAVHHILERLTLEMWGIDNRDDEAELDGDVDGAVYDLTRRYDRGWAAAADDDCAWSYSTGVVDIDQFEEVIGGALLAADDDDDGADDDSPSPQPPDLEGDRDVTVTQVRGHKRAGSDVTPHVRRLR